MKTSFGQVTKSDRMENFQAIAARNFGYSEDLIYILNGCSEQELANKYPETYRNLVSCKDARDNRTILEYAKMLIENWLFEDGIVYGLKRIGLDIELSGGDKDRKILAGCNVSQTPDTLIHHSGKSIYMEIIRNKTGYWERTRSITSLRNGKARRLKKDQALCLCVSTNHGIKKYAILDFRKNIKFGETFVNEGIGGKEQTPIYLDDNGIQFKSLDFQVLKSEIEQVI